MCWNNIVPNLINFLLKIFFYLNAQSMVWGNHETLQLWNVIKCKCHFNVWLKRIKVCLVVARWCQSVVTDGGSVSEDDTMLPPCGWNIKQQLTAAILDHKNPRFTDESNNMSMSKVVTNKYQIKYKWKYIANPSKTTSRTVLDNYHFTVPLFLNHFFKSLN